MTLEPSESCLMMDVARPGKGDKEVNIQQRDHQASSRARCTISRVIGLAFGGTAKTGNPWSSSSGSGEASSNVILTRPRGTLEGKVTTRRPSAVTSPSSDTRSSTGFAMVRDYRRILPLRPDLNYNPGRAFALDEVLDAGPFLRPSATYHQARHQFFVTIHLSRLTIPLSFLKIPLSLLKIPLSFVRIHRSFAKIPLSFVTILLSFLTRERCRAMLTRGREGARGLSAT